MSAHQTTAFFIGGPADGQTKQFEIARPGGLAQDPHLAAGVVEVIFPVDVMSGGGEHAGNGIAEHGVATVPHA